MNEATKFKLALGVLIGAPLVGLLKVFFPTYPIIEVYGIITLVTSGYFGARAYTDVKTAQCSSQNGSQKQ